MTKDHWQIAADIAQVVTGVTSVIAIFVAPWIALELQKRRENAQKRADRRRLVFETLMSSRATPLSPEFVQALNSIDLTFDTDEANDKAVREAWKVLLDHFSNGEKDETFPKRSQDLTVRLLSQMGKSLGMTHLDEVYLKRHSYYPLALSNMVEEQQQMRRLLIQLLKDERRLPVAVFPDKFPEI